MARNLARFGGIGKFMNLKRAFEDAKLQHQRGMETQGARAQASASQQATTQAGATRRSALATGRYQLPEGEASSLGLEPRDMATAAPSVEQSGGYDWQQTDKGEYKKLGKSTDPRADALTLIQMEMGREDYTLVDLINMWPVGIDKNDPDFLELLRLALEQVPKRKREAKRIKELFGINIKDL